LQVQRPAGRLRSSGLDGGRLAGRAPDHWPATRRCARASRRRRIRSASAVGCPAARAAIVSSSMGGEDKTMEKNPLSRVLVGLIVMIAAAAAALAAHGQALREPNQIGLLNG